jgi:hypothetical protein
MMSLSKRWKYIVNIRIAESVLVTNNTLAYFCRNAMRRSKKVLQHWFSGLHNQAVPEEAEELGPGSRNGQTHQVSISPAF